MSTWEQVKHITTFELKRNGITPLLLLVYAVVLFITFASETTFKHSILFDIVFLALFSGSFTSFARPNAFKPQIVGQNISVSHPVIFLQQLPVNNQAIIYSRIIIHNVYNIFMQLCFITPFYIFIPAFRETMSFPILIVFVVLWMSIGVSASGSIAADDAGKSLHTRDRAALIRLIIYFSFIIGALFALYTYTPYSLISGSIAMAQNWPFITLLGAILIASTGIVRGRRKMNRILQTTDYI